MAEPQDEGRVVATARIRSSAGLMSPKKGREWRKVQVPYRNYAGFSDRLDNECSTFVLGIRERFRARMSGPMRRWGINWSAANTEVFWHEREDDIHMPETKKALDSKVARVDEGVTQFDPVFEVEGVHGEINRRTAKTIGAFVYRQMELANWKALVQPCARDAELCNIAAVKVVWEEVEESIVERDDAVAHDEKTGAPVYVPVRRMRRAITRRGPKLVQVDPFWMIYDLEAANVQECAYIGDESLQFLHDLEAMARQGVYSASQVERVAASVRSSSGTTSHDGAGRTEWPDQMRQFRSIAMSADITGDQPGGHGAPRVRVIELWAWYDFGDGIDGVTDPLGRKLQGMQRVVITLANNIPIRIQQNPFDRKFVPYAFTQINRTGHELVAPAPFDSVVQMNAHYDRWSSNVMRWSDLSVAPIVLTNDVNTDLPDSLADLEAGAVIHNSGAWNFIKVPDISSSVGYFHGFFRNEMEELSGALRIHESPQGTATEVERKVQEQQRMVRNSIRAAGELWRQVAVLCKNMCEQFMTGPEVFRVVGKSSRLLGRQASVTPQMLREDVEFRFLGLSDLHTFGNRAQGMAQFMNMWGPMLQAMPDLNLRKMARTHFELLVGRAGTDDMFPNTDAPWDAWSQEEENEMLLAGMLVDVNEHDDDERHIQVVSALLRSQIEAKAPKFVIDAIVAHLNGHMRQLQEKQAAEQSELRVARRRQAIAEVSGGVPGIDKPPEPGGMEAQPKGVTPGPEQARTVAKTGRDGAGMSQTQMMQ